MNPVIIMPPDYLKNYVRYFWALESNADCTTDRKFRAMADGCPGMIFQQADYGCLYQENKKLPETFLFGQSTGYYELFLTGKFNTIGVYFQPNALQSVFGLNAELLTNTCIDIDQMERKENYYLSEQLSETTSITEKINVLSSFLLSQISNNKLSDNRVMDFAMTQIMQSDGSITLSDLQQKIQLSERSLERKFKESLGISPKLFSRICRFQSSLKQLQNKGYDKLSDIAFENNYADQSHFIRSFKEFSGFSPYEYQKKSSELVENFSELI